LNDAEESIMPSSPWAMPDVPDVDLATFALRHAVRLADRPALIDGDRVVTYAELAERVERAAGALSGHGVVALRRPNSAQSVLLLGALRAGAAVTPVSPLYTEREVADQLRLTGAEIVTEAVGPARPLPAVDPGAVALMLSSSGTTGLPKIVQLTHRAAVTSVCQFDVPFPYREGERVLGLAPMFHIMGLSCVLLHALSTGATVVTMPRFDLEEMLRTIEQHRVSQVLIPPPVLGALAQHPLVDSFDLSSLRVVGVGGAPATAELERAAMDRLGCLVGQGYGMTEAGPMIAVTTTDPPAVRPGSVGRLVPGTEARLVYGEVWVRGPQLMSGYLGDPEATAATIDADGWLHTGDLGRFDDDGYLYLGDRLKELIKVKGFQVAPAEVEAVLRAHPSVADAAVVGVPDEEAGERPMAFVVARGELDRDELQRFADEQLAPYKRPREIVELDALPRSPTGKLLRRMLVAEAVA
jgi:acyl-CoA synthetase (AMP-forming)/AMP-acid ligase II